MSQFDVYQVNDVLCLSHCLSLSHTSFCSPVHSPTFQSFTCPLILFLTLLLYFSLSLSLSFSLVFALAFSLRLSFSGFLSVFLFLHYTHTRAHAVTHSLSSNARTHQIFMRIFLAHSHIFLYHLSLSFPLSLSLSLLHTYTDTHTHSHSHTLSLMNSLIHTFIVVACARCVVFSARTRALSLLSVSLPLPSFLVGFLSDSISFVLFLASWWLASSPSLSHSFAPSFFLQLLVTMISI